jgi:hypothetical protein
MGTFVGKVLPDITMSLGGPIAGPDASPERAPGNPTKITEEHT